MTGVERIKGKILEEARKKADGILEQAGSEADRILAEATEKADNISFEVLEKGKKLAAERYERLVAASRLDARKQKLDVKQQMIDSVFGTALERLVSMPDRQYMEALLGMILAAARTGNEELILSEKDKARLPEDFGSKLDSMLHAKGIPGKITISDETRNISGGFILKDGDVEINGSFETLLKMQRERLESEIVSILFT